MEDGSTTDASVNESTIYYCSHPISAQKGVDFTGDAYGDIRKAYRYGSAQALYEAEELRSSGSSSFMIS